MERLFLECTVRVFLLISATAILLHIMRVKDAAAKHRVWTGVMALMLLLPVWATWGPKVSLRVLPPLPRAMSHGPIVTEGSLQAPVAQKLSSGELLLVSVYLGGFCVLVLRLAVGTIHTRRLIRYAVLQDGVRTSPLCASPVTVGFFCPMVIFPENWREWEQYIRVIEDPGHGFAQEAVAVVKKWKFNPATLKDGKPTKTRTTVEVQFTWHSD